MNGKIIGGKYRILELKGVGGMAKVYRAQDLESGKTVAVKFLKEENQQNAEYVRRFEREAQAGMSLQHPNIVKLINTGVHEGANYIIFEYVDGPTLKDYIRKHGVFSPRAAVNIIGHILDAIGYAHDHGVIHRDVKPQNVIITSNGTVKLADFGIARLMNASTRSFMGVSAMGSVHYISPEQAEGKETTCQTDLYSVGIILYEMLTGKVPFDNDNEVSVAVMHIKDKLKEPKEVNPEISHALNAVILKATAKDLSRRYKTAVDLKNDLMLAMHEPDGTFADLPEETSDTSETDTEIDDLSGVKMIGKLNSGIFGTGVALLACLFVIIVAFFIVRATHKPTVTVANLVNMTVEEAEKALGESLELEIRKEASEKTPGYIIDQDPSEGARLKKGATVTVVVSIGSEHVVAPNLYDMTVTEASALLQTYGLGITGIEYVEDENMGAGLVCRQEPSADSEVKLGTGFTLYVSGKPEKIGKMPKVSDMSIEKAVETLNEAGFEKIIVRHVADTGTREGNVISQELEAGLSLDTNAMIFLSVSATHGKATYDGAYNLSLENGDTQVLITIDTGKGYEIVAYEAVESGSLIASFTAYMDEEGTYDCIVYVGGVENKRTSVKFTVND
ncbi:MAG: protein kinase [Clostridia bacterium]|nr:protein kinase [Clostridia bacterium]